MSPLTCCIVAGFVNVTCDVPVTSIYLMNCMVLKTAAVGPCCFSEYKLEWEIDNQLTEYMPKINSSSSNNTA